MVCIILAYSGQLLRSALYKINKKNFPVIIFVVTDHNRQSRIVAFAIVACECLVILDVILDHFKKPPI